MNKVLATSVLVILNGKKASNPGVRQAVKQLRKEGYSIDVRVTWEDEDVVRYVHEAYWLKIGVVVAAGGDGTINQVSTAIARLPFGKKPALGILPLGTANDFATACMLPTNAYEALSLIFKVKAVPVDLAVVNDKHYFINMATGGFGTKVTTQTPEKLKAALGGFSYLLHGISQANTLKPSICKITSDGFSWSGEALVLGIGNGKQAGGGHQLCPDAKINDGMLQLSVLMAAQSVPILLSSLMDGRQSKHIVEKKLAWLEISSDEEMILNLDGEPLKEKHYSIKVQPSAIDCHLPENCPLLTK